jgi:hypothetical protein
MNLKKIGVLVFVMAFMAISAFAQTTDEYVVVVITLERNTDWTFEFSNSRFSLSAIKDSYAKALAQLLNYMYRNNYVAVLNEYNDDNFGCIIFRKK